MKFIIRVDRRSPDGPTEEYIECTSSDIDVRIRQAIFKKPEDFIRLIVVPAPLSTPERLEMEFALSNNAGTLFEGTTYGAK